jgi:hypothetical protein
MRQMILKIRKTEATARKSQGLPFLDHKEAVFGNRVERSFSSLSEDSDSSRKQLLDNTSFTSEGKEKEGLEYYFVKILS